MYQIIFIYHQNNVELIVWTQEVIYDQGSDVLNQTDATAAKCFFSRELIGMESDVWERQK